VFVEDCLRDRVVLVCVVGEGCEKVEDVIDELVVGDGSDLERFLTTTAHAGESLDEVRRFARGWSLGVDPASPIQEVRLV
jgi:hypothetical protein